MTRGDTRDLERQLKAQIKEPAAQLDPWLFTLTRTRTRTVTLTLLVTL